MESKIRKYTSAYHNMNDNKYHNNTSKMDVNKILQQLHSDMLKHAKEENTNQKMDTTDEVFYESVVRPLINSLPTCSKFHELIGINIYNLNIPDLNACAYYNAHSKSIEIAVNYGLMSHIYHYVTSIMTLFFIHNEEDRIEFIVNNYLHLLCNIKNHENNVPTDAIAFYSDDKAIKFIHVLSTVNLLEIYVLAHELAHIYCKHVDIRKTYQCDFGHLRLNVLSKAKEQELEADIIGYELYRIFIKSLGNKSTKWPEKWIYESIVKIGNDHYEMAVPLMIFMLMNLLEKNLFKNRLSITHPDAVVRFENLKGYILKDDEQNDDRRKKIVSGLEWLLNTTPDFLYKHIHPRQGNIL